ncbi:hypothetical protein [Methylorubrum extorquens]
MGRGLVAGDAVAGIALLADEADAGLDQGVADAAAAGERLVFGTIADKRAAPADSLRPFDERRICGSIRCGTKLMPSRPDVHP